MKSYGMPHGLGMGGSLEKFRFYIPDTLEGCTACASCLTFEPGAMLEGSSDGSFSISIMEVWGCGGEELIAQALEGQAKDRGARDALINKARQVDKAAFAGNSFDQEFLLSKNFSHKVRMADESACHMTNVDDSDRKATSADSKH
ncbi:unnamed protein product [Symbiodinium microadriaticum]|nr:unnamed protein product [Symbiodinium microadriaticum]